MVVYLGLIDGLRTSVIEADRMDVVTENTKSTTSSLDHILQSNPKLQE